MALVGRVGPPDLVTGSPVGAATIIAAERESIASRESELARSSTGMDGTFHLQTSRPVDGFYAEVPFASRPPGSSDVLMPDETQAKRPVLVRTEWLSGGAAGGDVRLVLATGWRLDILVIDGTGHPLQGSFVSMGRRAARTDDDGPARSSTCPKTACPSRSEWMSQAIAPARGKRGRCFRCKRPKGAASAAA